MVKKYETEQNKTEIPNLKDEKQILFHKSIQDLD